MANTNLLLRPLRRARARRIERLVARSDEAYRELSNREEYWLDGLNSNWQRLVERVGRYKEMFQEGRVPPKFDSIAEFLACVPECSKKELRDNIGGHIDSLRAPDIWKSTGGSTATPIQIPMWKEELTQVRTNQWSARAWHGLDPASKLFLLWGHSHLFGSGVKGWFNARKREVQDNILGYYRFSAYNLSEERMHECAKKMGEFAPDYVYGYSVALDRFARLNYGRKDAIRNLGIKRVQATAESFPYPASKDLVEDVFGCQVIMEYGAVETGVMASTNMDTNYSVFWRDFFLEAVRDEGGAHRLLVTTLYPRALPLVRFDMGDLVELLPEDSGSEHVAGLACFSSVKGRCFEGVNLENGKFIHSGIFSQLVRDLECVHGFQVHQTGMILTMRYLGSRDLSGKELNLIRRRCSRIDDSLSEMKFTRVAELDRTVAGKSPAVVIHN